MIRDEIIIERYNWHVYVYMAASKDDAPEILAKLDEIGIRASEYMRAERHLQKAFRDNTGMTYSNPDTRTTVMVIGRSTSEAETVNTFSHELRHLSDDLAEACTIPHHGEEIAYLTGDIACVLAGSLLRIVCDCPKCSNHE